MKTERLDSLIRGWGYATRKQVRILTADGRIKVDGAAVSDAAMKVGADSVIEIDGARLKARESVTLMLNKPAAYVSTAHDAFYPSVFELLDGQYKELALFAVGRLDADTEGLLLLTNDGALCDDIIRPESGIEKTYAVTFDRPLAENSAERLKAGITLREGVRCRPAYLELRGEKSALITVSEGKYHEVKRLIRACGAQVSTLKRVSIGALRLDESLAAGEYRTLSKEEIPLLYNKKMLCLTKQK